MRYFILFSIALAVSYTAMAQQRTRTLLTGSVRDRVSGRPLIGASVLLADSRNGTITDSSGQFILQNIPSGHTIIEVSHTGYKTLVEHLDLQATAEHHFMLSPSMLENEGVTITAVANATSIRKASIPITRLNKTELMSNASTNIIDALGRQPGLSQLSSGPAVSKPVIRGLGYNRLVVINDGVRQEGQQWGDEHGIEIDENSVSRVEIVKGPASLIYGSDAIGGVINIVTTVPVPLNKIQGTAISSFATNNLQRSFFANLGGNKNGFNWNAWGDYKLAADYRNRYDGRVYNSKFREKNVGGYAGVNGSWGFTHLILSSFNQALGIIEGERDDQGNFLKLLPGTTPVPATVKDFNATDPQLPYQHVHHFKLTSDNSFRLGSNRLSLTLAWQRNEREEFADPDAPGIPELVFNLNTFNYSSILHLRELRSWNTSVGMNGMIQTNANGGSEVLIPEYRLFDIGSFLYSQKSWKKTTLSGGIRFDHRSLDTEGFSENAEIKFNPISRSYNNFSASLGFSHASSDHIVFRMNMASGFRAPSIPELSSNGTHEGTNRYEYGAPELKSERSVQTDLGIEMNSDHLLLTASLFYNRIGNFIFYNKLASFAGGDSTVEVDGEQIPAFRFNQQDARLFGGEVLIDLHPHPLDWLHWQNTFSYVRGRFNQDIDGEKDLPLMPPMRWISELRGEFFEEGKKIRNLQVHVEADHSFAQEHYFSAFSTETATPGYTLFHARLSANLVRHNRVVASVFLNAQNLGNVSYQQHLSRLKYTALNPVTGRQGVFNMGRNFSVRVLVPFSF